MKHDMFFLTNSQVDCLSGLFRIRFAKATLSADPIGYALRRVIGLWCLGGYVLDRRG
jgi:hypothetical protein